MRNCRRKLSISLIIIFLLNILLSYNANAIDNSNNNKQLMRICEQVTKEPIDKNKVKDLVANGLSTEDAKFYLQFDRIVDILEKEEITIKLCEGYEEISDRDFAENQNYYRKKILEGDERAIIKALKTLNNLFLGQEYAEKLISTYSNKDTYEVVYPDGTKIIYTSKLKDLNEKRNEGINDLDSQCYINLKADEYKETLMDDGIAYSYEGIGAREGEWSFQSGLSYSKVYLYTEFILGEDNKSYITYARGGQSSYGVVNIANSTGATISRQQSEGKYNLPAEARNEVIFNVTGSFGGNFLALSLSVNPGANWTQYVVFRIFNPEEIDGDNYGARYTWHAAAFK